MLENEKIRRVLLALIIANIFLNYVLLKEIYRPHNIDDPWSLSLAYNYVKYGIEEDLMFVGDTEGLKYFRKTYALIYGHALAVLGWSYGGAQNLSALLVVAGGLLWFLSLGEMGFERNSRIAFIALFFYLEFSFTAANSLRYEALLLFFQGLSLYLLLRNRFFESGLCLVVALETHPVAVMNAAYLAACVGERLWHRHRSGDLPDAVRQAIRPALLFVSGCAAGLAYYLYLHYDALGGLAGYLARQTEGGGRGALGHYFFSAKYGRHLPELAILGFSLFVFWRAKINGKNVFALSGFALLLALSFIRHNAFYASLIYPAMLLVIVSAFQELRRLGALLLFFIVLLAPQYAAVYRLNADWDREAYLHAAQKIVPDDGIPVVGSSTIWFAFMQRKNFKTALYPADEFAAWNPRSFYLLEDRFLRESEIYAPNLRYFGKHYDVASAAETVVNGQRIVLKTLILSERKLSGQEF